MLDFADMDIREFLISPVAYLAPEKTLEGLSTEDAERHVSGLAHSVAEIVAHLAFWQDWFYARCTGEAKPMVASAAAGWPTVTAGSWPAVQSRFVDRLQQLAVLAEHDVTGTGQAGNRFPTARTLHDRRRARPRRHPQ